MFRFVYVIPGHVCDLLLLFNYSPCIFSLVDCLVPPHTPSLLDSPVYMGRYGSGGKSCRLAVGGLHVRSHPGLVEVSLSKTPNPQLLLTSWLVPCMAANRRWCVNVCVNG